MKKAMLLGALFPHETFFASSISCSMTHHMVLTHGLKIKTGDLQISYHTVEMSVFLNVLVSHWEKKEMFLVGDLSKLGFAFGVDKHESY